jgi:EAL domain-containing protein (putative c-di-GMP-specific phosphodiesterase class I)/CBS domain-containing protein
MKVGELDRDERSMNDVSGTIPPGSGAVAAAAWLDDLLASEHLFVAFQPIVDLGTGDVIGREVLGRIGAGATDAHARGVTGPQALLELAHAHGKLVAADRRFREIGIEALARAGSEGMFFLNVDPRVIDDPAFSAGFTRRLLEANGVPPTRIVLELTESGAVLDSDRLERIVQHYASQGFRIALDDVGAGYASLTALIRVRPHFLKLDKALVRHLAEDPLRAHLVRSLADFGRRAGIQVIAEGIEDEQDLLALLSCGVELGQGYLLARPAPDPSPLASPVKDMVRRAKRESVRPGQSLPPPRMLGLITRAQAAVHHGLLVEEVASLLRRGTSHAAVVVIDGEGRAVGIVSRERLLAEIAHLRRSGRPVAEVMDPHPLRLDEATSLEVALRLASSRDEGRIYDPVIVEQNGRYLGVATVHGLMRAIADGSAS